ncbi:pyridoxal phosphate-dependent aminotransferase [Streptomyces sp. NPDC001851]|uniref:pyridoxal phosphate-dependent aminotransferase n=1 Tax=Streptomyces sp. NPDC001851 TaxID=3154529 RepID=UPI003332B6C8
MTRAARRVRHLPGGGLAALLSGGRTDLVNLAVGTPAYPQTPPELIDRACAALRSGVNQYADPVGDPALRERLAASLPGAPDPATEITITVGGSEGLCVALLTTVDPGDEVVVLEPFYENFVSAIAMAGGRPRFVRLREPDWTLDEAELAAAFSSRTKAVIINSPSNPTGTLLDRPQLEHLADLCTKWDVTVISDEVYAPYVYDGRTHCSAAAIPALADRSIVVGSLSKTHTVSGWRLGYLRARPRWTSLLRQVHVATTAGAPSPLQRAAAEAGLFGPPAWDPAPLLSAQRDRTVRMLREAGFDCASPPGGCYVMAGIRGLTTEDSPTFTRVLAADAGVLLAPGTAFFADPARGAGYVRVAFNRPPHTLDQAEQRLRDLARDRTAHRVTRR